MNEKASPLVSGLVGLGNEEEKTIVDGSVRPMKRTEGAGPWLLTSVVLLSGAVAGCQEETLTLPTTGEIESAYLYAGDLSAELSGNVAEITVVQPSRQLRRGGPLWAKVGPYVLLFSEETEGLFRDFPGLAGVRVITVSTGGTEVARALLPRNELNDVTWRKARHIAGLARRDGTKQPTLLEALVEWGEDHTEYNYNLNLTQS